MINKLSTQFGNSHEVKITMFDRGFEGTAIHRVAYNIKGEKPQTSMMTLSASTQFLNVGVVEFWEKSIRW